MKFIALKTENGLLKGEISFCCRVLHVSRQGFAKYLLNLEKPWKYESLAAKMQEIVNGDECNDCYGSHRMYEALQHMKSLSPENFPEIPSERTVYRIMQKIGLIHQPKRKPNGITKSDREAMKSDDKIKRDFTADAPLEKCVSDITEVQTAEGKLYIAVIEDCFDNMVLGLSMADNMCASLCADALANAMNTHPRLRGALVHSDRGSQYTSEEYRSTVEKFEINQSMNSAAGKCHDNAKCESLWARFKEELLYNRYNTKEMSMEAVKSLVWRYFMSYWNNRRICSAIGGVPPAFKRMKYYQGLADLVA